MTFLHDIKERFLGTTYPEGTILYEGKKVPEAKIVQSQYSRERPLKVDFKRLILYHDATPQIRLPVTAYRELITGTEMILTSEDDKATEHLNEWVRRTNFYDKFENMVTTLLICGNAILEKLSENDLQDVSEVDMSTVIAKKRSPVGELEYYEQRQEQGKVVKLGEGNISRFIEFNLTHYSKQAWGRSLFYSAAIPRTIGERTMPPLIEVLWSAEDAMGAILMNDAYPLTTITYLAGNDEFLQKETEKWRRHKPGDKRIGRVKPEIEFWESQHSAGRYEPHIAHLEKAIEQASQFPTDIMTGEFTSRASSDTTENITTKLVRGYQRYLCNKLKADLFEPILEQAGFNTQDVELEVSFTAETVIELEPTQVLDIRRNGDMTRSEYRDWLRKNTGMELDAKFDEQDPEQAAAIQAAATQQQQQQQQDPMQKKVNDMESQIKLLRADNDTNIKLLEMKETFDHKITMLKEAAEQKDNTLFKRREKVLEKLLTEVKKIG